MPWQPFRGLVLTTMLRALSITLAEDPAMSAKCCWNETHSPRPPLSALIRPFSVHPVSISACVGDRPFPHLSGSLPPFLWKNFSRLHQWAPRPYEELPL